jgi:hypothetical protein
MRITARLPIGRRATLLVGPALALAVVAGCSPGVDANHATTIATNFLAAGQPSGYLIDHITTDPPQDMGSTWRVKVDATFRDPAHPDSGGCFPSTP